ncbi:putative target of rapamycin (TOR) kinase 1 [Trypanosoma cruzi]|uniref:Putative target of rapamycin (TOR) kinase 1 n=1 Tax=Trypanosoma cruzi TaxID=5693 RepID=A0A2V2XJR3_TRYCR|nr:putative target of rapamycin (TOR) kinase 1 [Trypanosoma cruzi]RNC36127.1 target of rapamycin (TOR) kinase 1 [Trypanosoma cruzi]
MEGNKASPEILRIIITSTIAVVTTVVHFLWAAPPLVRVDVWIDNIRSAGSKSNATWWEAQVMRNADGRYATMGEECESGAAQYTFLWMQFDHTHRAVFLSDKFVRSVRAMPALNSSNTSEMEAMVSRFLYLAAILGTRLCGYYFFIKAVQRRLSALNRGILQETSPGNLPPAAIGLGERSRHIIEYNRDRNNKPTEKASAAIIRDASLHGWGAVFIQDSGDVKIAGGKWERKPFLIMQAEVRAVRLALSALSAILPSTMDVWVKNTLLQGAANKGSSKSHAMTWELRRIYGFLDSREIKASFGYVWSAQNPADGISRGLVFKLQELAKGSGGVLWLEDPKVCHLLSNYVLRTKDNVSGQQNIYILRKTLRQLTASSILPFFSILFGLYRLFQDPVSGPEDYSLLNFTTNAMR